VLFPDSRREGDQSQNNKADQTNTDGAGSVFLGRPSSLPEYGDVRAVCMEDVHSISRRHVRVDHLELQGKRAHFLQPCGSIVFINGSELRSKERVRLWAGDKVSLGGEAVYEFCEADVGGQSSEPRSVSRTSSSLGSRTGSTLSMPTQVLRTSSDAAASAAAGGNPRKRKLSRQLSGDAAGEPVPESVPEDIEAALANEKAENVRLQRQLSGVRVNPMNADEQSELAALLARQRAVRAAATNILAVSHCDKCEELCVDARQSSCGHLFCRVCIMQCDGRCPRCRLLFVPLSLSPSGWWLLT
jgi:FHA domain